MNNKTKTFYLELIPGVTECFEVDRCWGNPIVNCLCDGCAAKIRHIGKNLKRFEYQTYDTCALCQVRTGADYAEFEYVGYGDIAA